MLIGEEGTDRLQNARVLIFGLGGVGSYTAEALARSGVGHFRLVDADTVAESNLNRQLIATRDTLGMLKTDADAARIRSLRPDAQIETYPVFYGPDAGDAVPWDDVDYAVDAVDTVTAKLFIIEQARRHGVPVISSMGTGNKMDPSRLRIASIRDTRIDPLARVMRRELRRRGMEDVPVVYSEEEPLRPLFDPAGPETIKKPPGSTAFVPGAAGLLIASRVVSDLAQPREIATSGR